MRYYSIILKNPKTGAVLKPASLGGKVPDATYTSLVNGVSLPGALNVELDVPVSVFAAPIGQPFVRVWGISLQEISQSSDLNGSAIEVYGGMQKGLPLANPKQAGLLFSGYVFQALGNWIGTDMTLDLVLSAFPTTVTPPNISLDWKKGTPLSQALATTLTTAFPTYRQSIQVSPNLILANDEPGFYSDIVSFAQYVKQRSVAIVGGDYKGVEIHLSGTSFSVYDGTTQSTPKQLEYQDMVGQPTWIDPSSVQVKLVMRGDISVGDYIKFPASPVVSSPSSSSPFVNQKLTFQGSFLVKRVRPVGNFRQPDASSWVTVIDAATTPVAATTAKAA